MKARSAFAPLLVVASLVGCSNGDVHVVLPSFSDVSDAPAAIQTAAKAVVRIETAGSGATGSFISPDGMLLTNNHVLGVGICPSEGCYAQLTFGFQRHSPVSSPQTVFVVPKAVDVGLDMALVQVYSSPGSAPLATPNYLTIASRDAASLQGTSVHVVGHPEAHLKKWTHGEVVDSDGTWIWFTNYSLPGNSGSPILDDAGQLVGILHRGPTEQDLVSATGVDTFAIGTASAALVGAMSEPLPVAMWSVANDATNDQVVQHEVVYLNAHQANANVNGVTQTVLSSLGVACDTGLARQDYASPDDLSSALTPCTEAEFWIECRSDVTGTVGFSVCPPDVDAWSARYQAVYDHWIALNGELSLDELTFGQASLAASRADGVSAGAARLSAALETANPPLDFNVAAHLAAFDVNDYLGTGLVGYVRGYASVPGYALSATDVAATALWLLQYNQLSRDDTISLLQGLSSDNTVDIGTKLYIEDVLYRSGILD